MTLLSRHKPSDNLRTSTRRPGGRREIANVLRSGVSCRRLMSVRMNRRRRREGEGRTEAVGGESWAGRVYQRK